MFYIKARARERKEFHSEGLDSPIPKRQNDRRPRRELSR